VVISSIHSQVQNEADSGPSKEFNGGGGGLVSSGLEQLAKDQREKMEAMYQETQLIAEQGLDTDEIIFLEDVEEKKLVFQEQQQREIDDFKVR
jgi:hypothetical protein